MAEKMPPKPAAKPPAKPVAKAAAKPAAKADQTLAKKAAGMAVAAPARKPGKVGGYTAAAERSEQANDRVIAAQNKNAMAELLRRGDARGKMRMAEGKNYNDPTKGKFGLTRTELRAFNDAGNAENYARERLLRPDGVMNRRRAPREQAVGPKIVGPKMVGPKVPKGSGSKSGMNKRGPARPMK